MAQRFYSARNENGGAPSIVAGTIASAYTTDIIEGAPVVLSSAGNLENATLSTATVSSTKLWGFANADRRSVVSALLPRHIPIPPAVNDKQALLELLNVNRAGAPNIHSYPLKSDQSPAITDIETLCDIEYDSTNKTFYLNKSAATNAIARIVGIRHDQIGVLGGIVDFIVVPTAVQVFGVDIPEGA